MALGSLLRWWARLEGRYWGEAEDALSRMLRLEPDNPRALHALGLLKLESGDYPAAEAAFRRILERQPQSLPARLGLTLVHLAAGRPDEARVILRRCGEPIHGPVHERIRGYNS